MKKQWLMFLVLVLIMALLPGLALGEEAQELAVEIKLDKQSVHHGETITATFDISGGVEPYDVSYAFIGKERGEEYALAWFDPVEGDSVSYTPTFGDAGVLMVSVSDSDGHYLNAEKTFVITGDLPEVPFKIITSLDKTTAAANLGETLTASFEITGGRPPYRTYVSWAEFDEEHNISGGENAEFDTVSGSHTYRPWVGVNGSCWVQVTDADGRYLSEFLGFYITGADQISPFSITLTTDRDGVDLVKGESIIGTYEINGGTPPFEVECHGYVMDTGDRYQNLPDLPVATEEKQVVVKPLFGTEGSFTIYVKDKEGRKAAATTHFTISRDPATEKYVMDASLNKTSVNASVSEEILVNWAIQGGSAPYRIETVWTISESYYLYIGEKVKSGVQEGDSASGSDGLSVRKGKKGGVRVTATDSLGRIADKALEFTILGEPDQTEPLAAQIGFSPAEAEGNQLITAAVEITGGRGPYTCQFNWYAKDSDGELEDFFTQEPSAEQVSEAKVPNLDGQGLLVLKVQDADQRKADFQAEFSIKARKAVLGDATDDGKVDEEDLKALVDHLVEEAVLASMEGANADGEGQVDVDDLLAIINMLVGD